MNDLCFALRQLAKSPGFTAVVVLSLALGIGANAAVLCWLQNLFLRPMPGGRDPQELVVLASKQGSGPGVLLIVAANGPNLLLACYFPARRAARVNPIEALRAE